MPPGDFVVLPQGPARGPRGQLLTQGPARAGGPGWCRRLGGDRPASHSCSPRGRGGLPPVALEVPA